MGGWIIGWMDYWKDGLLEVWIIGRMDYWKDGLLDLPQLPKIVNYLTALENARKPSSVNFLAVSWARSTLRPAR